MTRENKIKLLFHSCTKRIYGAQKRISASSKFMWQKENSSVVYCL